jgi:hypothetical protein
MDVDLQGDEHYRLAKNTCARTHEGSHLAFHVFFQEHKEKRKNTEDIHLAFHVCVCVCVCVCVFFLYKKNTHALSLSLSLSLTI